MYNPNLKLTHYLLGNWVKSHYDAINISHTQLRKRKYYSL